MGNLGEKSIKSKILPAIEATCRENLFRGDDVGTSFVKSCTVHTSRTLFSFREEGINLPDSFGLFQHQAIEPIQKA